MKQRPRWREGRALLYGQVEKQQPHFSFNLVCSLLSLACTWFCATFASEFRLSHLDVHKHLHYSTPPASSSYHSAVYSLTVWLWVESTPPPPHPLRPPPLPAVPAAPKTRADRDHYCHREHREHKCPKDSSHAPVRCLPFVFHSFSSFSVSPQSNHPTLTKALTQWPKKLFRQAPAFNL